MIFNESFSLLGKILAQYINYLCNVKMKQN